MNTEEIILPVIAEDFEIGDKVYQHALKTDTMRFGVVEHAQDEYIFVRMEDRSVMRVNLEDFQPNSTSYLRWGKRLPLEQVQLGDVLSINYMGRKWFNKVHHINDSGLVLIVTDGHNYGDITEWDFTNGDSRDFVLRSFTLEP